MTIDRLNPAAGLLSLLRSEATARSERVGTADRARPTATAARSRDPEALRRDLRDIVQNLPFDDPEAVRSAQARMVRAILQWELGPEAREHPAWHTVVDSVTQTLQSAHDWDSRFRLLVKQLAK